MSHSLMRWSDRVLCGALSFVLSSSLNALEPPTAEQVRQYQADGTWEQRVAQAKALGNYRVDPVLAARTRARLEREAAKAAGLPVSKDERLPAPPPDWQGGLPAKGTVKALVLLIDFPDYVHGSGDTVSDVSSKFFGSGDSSKKPYESLHNFYYRSSYNQLDIQGNVLGWYRAAHNRSYYETAGTEALIMEAMNYYNDPANGGHDFTQYDNDNNGRIDAFYVKWTGPAGDWATFWWAYQTGWYSNPNYTIDGKHLGSYVWSWIWNQSYDGATKYQAHVDIHESGHLLGLPDLYDYDSSVGPKGGVGGYDMMDANKGDHNCFSKFMLEWLTPTFMTSGTQTLALNPSASSQDCVLIMPGYDYTAGTMFDEFFMAQYRKRSLTGGATCNDSAFPTDGLTIWHVDSTLNGGGFLYDNSYTAHKYVRLMEADGLEQIEAGGSGNSGDFYKSGKTFSDTATPNSKNYAGQYTGVQVDGLGTASTTMTATFSVIQVIRMEASGYNVTYETCQPGNGAVDPGETVTVNFTLLNTGTAPTTNLMGAIQATGGVTLPGAAGSFGASTPGGPPVSRPFTFTATGTCGGTLTATLQLQDGSTDFPSVTFAIPLGAPDGAGGYTCCVIPNGVGDFDGDGDADQEDFGRFQVCLTANGVTASSACQPGRMDADLDVDQADLAIFLKCHTQAGVVPDISCRN